MQGKFLENPSAETHRGVESFSHQPRGGRQQEKTRSLKTSFFQSCFFGSRSKRKQGPWAFEITSTPLPVCPVHNSIHPSILKKTKTLNKALSRCKQTQQGFRFLHRRLGLSLLSQDARPKPRKAKTSTTRLLCMNQYRQQLIPTRFVWCRFMCFVCTNHLLNFTSRHLPLRKE